MGCRRRSRGGSDGPPSIGKAVAPALPEVPHQLGHFPYLGAAARPIDAADRHAQKELKKRVRGLRAMARQVEARADAAAEALRGSCRAARSALTADGRPPVEAAGRKRPERRSAISTSLGRGQGKRGSRVNANGGRG
jgi:hypothetical protein